MMGCVCSKKTMKSIFVDLSKMSEVVEPAPKVANVVVNATKPTEEVVEVKNTAATVEATAEVIETNAVEVIDTPAPKRSFFPDCLVSLPNASNERSETLNKFFKQRSERMKVVHIVGTFKSDKSFTVVLSNGKEIKVPALDSEVIGIVYNTQNICAVTMSGVLRIYSLGNNTESTMRVVALACLNLHGNIGDIITVTDMAMYADGSVAIVINAKYIFLCLGPLYKHDSNGKEICMCPISNFYIALSGEVKGLFRRETRPLFGVILSSNTLLVSAIPELDTVTYECVLELNIYDEESNLHFNKLRNSVAKIPFLMDLAKVKDPLTWENMMRRFNIVLNVVSVPITASGDVLRLLNSSVEHFMTVQQIKNTAPVFKVCNLYCYKAEHLRRLEINSETLGKHPREDN